MMVLRQSQRGVFEDWFGDVQRRDAKHIARRMPRMELPDRRRRRRPGRRLVDAVRYEDAEDRVRLRRMIHCGKL